MRFFFRRTLLATLTLMLVLSGRQAWAQAFGVELHNTVMPASGAMGGASLARPQDLQSAINGNPATLASFEGTQFSFSGTWVEATFNLSHLGGVLPNLGAFSGRSEAEGSALGNIGVTQDFRSLGLPATLGVGLFASSGAGSSWRAVPESNGTSTLLQVLQIAVGTGIDLTDRLSAGANLMLGSGTVDGPFIDLTGAAYGYALRGSLGLSYEVGCASTIGCYYQTTQNFNFDDAVRLQLPAGTDVFQDLNIGLPDNIGIGIADESLLDGRLLLAADVLFKQWDNGDLFRNIYTNQWVFQAGAQYRYSRRVKLRLGYVYADDATAPNPGNTAGGITPPGAEVALRYVQSQFPVFNRHRISGGVGIQDILPGVDLDLLAGGMFRESQQYGALTSSNLESYWIGAGMTWRFGRGACQRLPTEDDWGGDDCGCN